MNGPSLAALLAHPKWHLPTATVAAESFARVADAARYLPARAVDGIILECRLRAGDPRVDLAVSVDHLAAAVPHFEPFASAGPLDAGRATWSRIVDLMRVWPDVFWFEFDLDVERVERLPLPSVFFRLPFEVVDDRKVLAPHGPDRAIEGLGRLRGTPLPRAAQATVAHCISSPPPGMRIHQVGAMLPRAGDRVRLCFYTPSLDLVAEFLAVHGHTATWDLIRPVVTQLRAWPAMVLVNVDVAEEVGPKVGIEIYPRAQPRDIAWQHLLDDLAAAGLCDPAKAAELPAWNGYASQPVVPAREGPQLLKRELRHIKVVAEPGTPLEAKIYLGLTVTPIRAGRLAVH